MQGNAESNEIQKIPPQAVKTGLMKGGEHFSFLYIMFYRHGMNANLTKGFYHAGDLMSARRRAEAHCKIMNYKFIFIRPLICDLEEEESYRLTGRDENLA